MTDEQWGVLAVRLRLLGTDPAAIRIMRKRVDNEGSHLYGIFVQVVSKIEAGEYGMEFVHHWNAYANLHGKNAT